MKRNGLKILRIKNDLYQSEMAEKVGTTTSGYSLIENGKRKGGIKFWGALKSAFNLTDEQINDLKNGKEI